MLSSARIQSDDLVVDLLDFGARIQMIEYAGKAVALSYENNQAFLGDAFYLGATVGPIANRVRNGRFQVGDKTVQLPQNEHPNCLHSGGLGLDKQTWQVIRQTESLLEFKCQVALKPLGMSGELTCTAVYQVNESALTVLYSSQCSDDTYLNLTNHVYLNLNGSGSVLDHEYRSYAASVYKRGKDNLPSLALDHLTPGQELDLSEQGFDGFIDHHFNMGDINLAESRPENLRRYIDIQSASSKLKVSVYGSAPGFQLYTGAGLGEPFNASAGFCVEPQFVPDAINRPDASPILKAGDLFERAIRYNFSTI